MGTPVSVFSYMANDRTYEKFPPRIVVSGKWRKLARSKDLKISCTSSASRFNFCSSKHLAFKGGGHETLGAGAGHGGALDFCDYFLSEYATC